jgi:hypothetical protein
MAGISEPLIIEGGRRKPTDRASAWLRGRRVFLAALLALVEVIGFLIWRPGVILATLFAALVLALALMGAGRVRRGLVRDVLIIIAIAQGLIVLLPLVLGFSILAGVLLVVVILAVVAVLAFRLRL